MIFGYVRKILSHSITYAGANLLVNLSVFLLLPVYTRRLTLEEFGALSLINTYGVLVLFVVDLGLATAFTRLYFDYQAHQRQERTMLTSTYLWCQAAAAGGLAVVGWAAAPAVNALVLGSFDGVYPIRLMTLAVFFNVLAAIPTHIFRVEQRPAMYFLLSAVKCAVLLGAILVLLLVFDRGLRSIFEGSVLATALTAALGLILTRGRYGLRCSGGIVRRMLRIGLAFYPAMWLGWGIDYVGMYWLRHDQSLQTVGVYALGLKLSQIIYFAVLGFSMGWHPILFGILQDDEARSGQTLAQLSRYYTVALTGLALLVSLFAPELVRFTGTSSYAEAGRILPILCVAYWCYGLLFFWLSGVAVSKKLEWQSVALLAGLLVQVAGSFALIPRWGIYGAGAAMVLSYGVSAACAFRFSQAVYRLPYRLGTVVRIGAAGAAAFGLASACGRLWGAAWLADGIGLASYGILLVVLRAVSREELSALGRRLAPGRRQAPAPVTPS